MSIVWDFLINRTDIPSHRELLAFPVLAYGVSAHVSGLRLRSTEVTLTFIAYLILPSALLNGVGILVDLFSQLNTEPARTLVKRFSTAITDGTA